MDPGLFPVPGPASTALGERFAATPRLACAALSRALSSGDLETAMACFSPDACLIGADGTAVHGEGAIRARLAELIDVGAEVAIELRGVLVAGDTALAHERWQISYEGVPDARALWAVGPTLVLRLIADEWKLAIAAPWGWAPAPPLEAVGAPR